MRVRSLLCIMRVHVFQFNLIHIYVFLFFFFFLFHYLYIGKERVHIHPINKIHFKIFNNIGSSIKKKRHKKQ